MFNLELGKTIKVRTRQGNSRIFYYVGLSLNRKDKVKPFVFWTTDSGALDNCCSLSYSKKQIEAWINSGEWVIIE